MSCLVPLYILVASYANFINVVHNHHNIDIRRQPYRTRVSIIELLLTVKAVTLIFISGRGLA